VDIYGDNATGKTTLFDAFIWLLFDKDSQNKKDFEIKTLDQNGHVLHGLDHEVEGVFEIDGKQLTLRKVYAEKWTKKRGSAKATFTGHTTDYYIDGVPVKKTGYTAKIAEIADENIFKLLTNPAYFNEQLHWQERRRILLEVCGDVSDEEVIASDKALARLPEILQGRKLEDHRKVIAAKRAEINKELEKIPVRIDEAQLSLPDVTGLNLNRLEEELQDLKTKKQAKDQELIRIQNGGEIAEKQKQLREIEAALLQIKNNLNAHTNDLVSQKRSQLNEVKNTISDLQRDIRNKEQDMKSNAQRVVALDQKKTGLRGKWHQVYDQEFAFEQDDTCPTCGQVLPAEKLAEAREKALANFNRDKAQQLEKITIEGKAAAAEAERLIGENKELHRQACLLKSELEAKETEAGKIETEITQLQERLMDPADSPEYKQKLAEKEKLEAAIAELKEGNQEAIRAVQLELTEIWEQLAQVEDQISKIKQCERGQARIEELKAQEKQLAKEYERLEQELYLTEQFIRTKVNLLEEKINSRFKLARFKLFDIQVNGAVVETAETTFNGVPYSSLNHGAQINVGLDIINTLSEHYGFVAPIFIDNREAVTKLIETSGQVISLIVSEPDKKLRVEVESEEPSLFKEVV